MNIRYVSVAVLALAGTASNSVAAGADGSAVATPDEPTPAELRQLVELERHSAVWQVGTPLEGVDAAWRAANARASIEAFFLPEGLRVVSSAGEDTHVLSLSLSAFGRDGALEPVGPGRLAVAGQRVESRRGALCEWYVNRVRGLEHGFTLDAPPEGVDGDAVVFELAVGGEFEAEVRPGARDAAFRSPAGTVISYGGLHAFDADQRTLPVRFEPTRCGLAITVDDRGARYPVTVDPLIVSENGKYSAEDSTTNDSLGWAVAIEGDVIAVGLRSDGSPLRETGSVVVFRFDGTAWRQEARFVPPEARRGQGVGHALALYEDTLIVGGPHTSFGGDGKAWVMRCVAGVWRFEAELRPSGATGFHQAGFAVDLEGDVALVGVPSETSANTGAVYAFERSGSSWVETARIEPDDLGGGANFGTSVALEGERLVAGADYGSDEVGAAYVFEKSAGTWLQTARLDPTGAFDIDVFGEAVALEGDRIAVGAPILNPTRAGYVIVYAFDGTAWNEEVRLPTPDTPLSDYLSFGASLAFDAGRLAVGATDDGPGSRGAVYLYDRSGASWSSLARLDVSSADSLGISVDLEAGRLITGAPFAGVNNAGGAHTFLEQAGTWSVEQSLAVFASLADRELGRALTLRPGWPVIGAPGEQGPAGTQGAVHVLPGIFFNNTRLFAYDGEDGDRFGAAVDGDESTIVVGAPGAALGRGSAYAFHLEGDTWFQEVRLSANNGFPLDAFGAAIAFDGELLLVGAPEAAHTGSVYAYRRAGGAWIFEGELGASDAALLDEFGFAVALKNDVAVIGAPGDDEGASEAGAAYVFRRAGGSWTEIAKLTAADPVAGARLGSAVAAGIRALAGAPGALAGAENAGAVYSFEENGAIWVQDAKLESPTPALGDDFGSALALDGSVALVGTPGADLVGADSGMAVGFELGDAGWSAPVSIAGSSVDAGDAFGSSLALNGTSAFVGTPGDDDEDGGAGAAYSYAVISTGSVGTPYCFGDGSGRPCPCGNNSEAGAGQGCRNGTGMGALLGANGSTSVADDDLVLELLFVPNQPFILFVGDSRVNGGNGVPFGKGLRCAGGQVVRYRVMFASGGQGTIGPGLGERGGWGPGDTRRFQAWLRDPIGGCNTFNTSNGLEVLFTP